MNLKTLAAFIKSFHINHHYKTTPEDFVKLYVSFFSLCYLMKTIGLVDFVNLILVLCSRYFCALELNEYKKLAC